jgi:hypothetical protein
MQARHFSDYGPLIQHGIVPLPKLRFDYTPTPHNGISYEENIAKRLKYLSPSLGTFQAFKKPKMFVRGECTLNFAIMSTRRHLLTKSIKLTFF